MFVYLFILISRKFCDFVSIFFGGGGENVERFLKKVNVKLHQEDENRKKKKTDFKEEKNNTFFSLFPICF